jgi:hypothetical protein
MPRLSDILAWRLFRVPTPLRQPFLLRARRQVKAPENDLLIIECDSANLMADRLNLGSAFYQLLNHDIAKLFLAKKSIALLKTSTKCGLTEQFAATLKQYGRFRAILIVGHSNSEGIQVASDEWFEWRVLGNWLEPFRPEIIFLAACEAGKSMAVRDLFQPLRETLLEIYASPVKLYGSQASSFAVLIARLLWTGEIDENESITARLVSYMSTGGQIYRWSYDETGPGAEIPATSWDDLAKVFDFGPWDLQRRIDEWMQRGRQSS